MRNVFLYIDPSTGSMLFAVIIGMVSAVFFGFKSLMMKVKTSFGVKRSELQDKNKLDYVIYSDHKRYWNVFAPICDEFENRGIEAHYWTQSEDDPALSKKYNHIKCEYIGSGNKGFARLNFMNAKICLSTTPGLDVYQWKRSRDCDFYAHVFHAAGLARGGYRMFGIDYYDALLSVSEHHCDYVRELEKKRYLPEKEIKVVGSTYLDAMMERYKNTNRPIKDNKMILIAPSWGVNSLLEQYGTKIIDAALATGYDVVVRPHPQMLTQNPNLLNKLKSKYNNVEWNFDNDNFNILNESDIMISDFSGVLFDYTLIFDKPVIYTKVDKDLSAYDDAVLDDNTWTDRILEKFAFKLTEDSLSNLKSIVDEMIDSDKYKEARKEVKDEIWSNRGNAAKTIVDYLINKNN